jgi:hypothetical protein
MTAPSSSGRHAARPVERPAACLCELLKAHPSDEIVYDDVPARAIEDPGDRALATNVAHVVQSLHAAVTNSMEWHVEFDDGGTIIVMVKFPARTVFTARQLALVETVNELRIKDVWIQPEDDCVYVGTTLVRSDVALQLTVQDIVILRRAVDDESKGRGGVRKRARGTN